MQHIKESSIDPFKWELAEELAKNLSDFGSADTSGTITAKDAVHQINRPPQRSLGDYAFPCFRFAKPFKMAPDKIAEKLKSNFDSKNISFIEKITIEGAFLNFFIDKKYLAEKILPSIDSEEFFNNLKENPSSEKVMIEYSQPNTHKEFHVGHMRNVALGDSLWRIYEYCGYEVVVANYIGDEGAHIAKCIWYIEEFDQKPEPNTNKGEWLGKMYVKAEFALKSAEKDSQQKYKNEMSRILKEIEATKGASYDFWVKSREWSLESFRSIYKWLDVRFDKYFYESEVSLESRNIVEEYLDKGVFIESDGAIGLDLKAHKLGFAILRKSDGNTNYTAKDLALAKKKFDEYKIDKSIYVVCEEQNYHFRQVFKSLEKMGFEKAKACYHLSYAFVVVPDGKMASRLGNVVTFSELKKKMTEELSIFMEKYKSQWGKETIDHTIHLLSSGAIKYGMVCSDPSKEIVFDIKNWLSFEGDTGPYLMYSYARSQSILRKAAGSGLSKKLDGFDLLKKDTELELILKLSDFHTEVAKALSLHKPSIISHYLFELCKAFNRFHSEVNVLKTEDKTLQSLRLNLVDCFSKMLKNGLYLIGITPPEQM